jgi:hypothetical protein
MELSTDDIRYTQQIYDDDDSGGGRADSSDDSGSDSESGKVSDDEKAGEKNTGYTQTVNDDEESGGGRADSSDVETESEVSDDEGGKSKDESNDGDSDKKKESDEKKSSGEVEKSGEFWTRQFWKFDSTESNYADWKALIDDFTNEAGIIFLVNSGFSSVTKMEKFAYCFKALIGKQIINEKHVSNNHKLVKTISSGGVAGGVKYLAKGLFIKFPEDKELQPGSYMCVLLFEFFLRVFF